LECDNNDSPATKDVVVSNISNRYICFMHACTSCSMLKKSFRKDERAKKNTSSPDSDK
jgi:hypothetical protein